MLQPLSEYLFTGRFALAVGLGGFVAGIISISALLFKRGGHFVNAFEPDLFFVVPTRVS